MVAQISNADLKLGPLLVNSGTLLINLGIGGSQLAIRGY